MKNVWVLLNVLIYISLIYGFGISIQDWNASNEKTNCNQISSPFYRKMEEILKDSETKVEKNIIAYVGNATIATPVSINMDSNRKLVKKYTPEKLFEYPLDFRFQVFQHDNDTELEYYGYVWVENIKCNWICDQDGSECSKVYCWNQPKFCNDNKQCFKRKDLCEDFDNNESGVLTNALEIEEFWVDKKPWFLLGSDWKCDRFGNDFFCKNYEYKEVLYYPSSLLKTLGG